MNLKITFLLAFLSVGLASFAQQQRTCSTDAFMQQQLENPEFRAQYEALQAKFEQRMELRASGVSNRSAMMTLFIPVAVHYESGNEADRDCLVALAQSQIDILNNDFRGTNADINQWPAASASYPGVNTGFLDVQFTLATLNHPAGTDPDLVEGEPAVTIGYNFGGGATPADNDASFAGYMNFVVRNIGGGILGYSPLGGSPAAGATVVMTTSAFGAGAGCPGVVPGAPYNLGRTLTHELGHFLNLGHTFSGSCATDDGVADTPNINQPSYGCPAVGGVTMCGNTSLTMNFMDYVNDACMFMLTEGQTDRSQAWLDVIEDQFNDNVLGVEEFEADRIFAIYPNPADNEITIQSVSNILKAGAKIELHDMLGRRVINETLNSSIEEQKINVSSLNEGVYLLKVSSENFSTTKKIVVKRS